MLEKEFMPDKNIICEQIAAILQKFIKKNLLFKRSYTKKPMV